MYSKYSVQHGDIAIFITRNKPVPSLQKELSETLIA